MSRRVRAAPSIYVLAGTNGAGKSSVAGAALRERDADYFNPDEAAREYAAANPGIPYETANAEAWHEGRRRLEAAIARRNTFAFETTLGGSTMTGLLLQAAGLGLAVRVWYVGLESPELHLERVRARVAAGGHDIPEGKVRERYDRSRENLIHLLPALTELALFDNSAPGDPLQGVAPRPLLVLRMRDGRIVETCELRTVPEWAKPIFVAAVRQYLA